MPKNLFEDDTWLEQKLRDSNPFPASLERDLDERALQDLASIMAMEPEELSTPAEAPEGLVPDIASERQDPRNVIPLGSKTERTRRWVLGSLAAAAAAVIVAVPIGTSINGAGKAVAAPLPLTVIKPSNVGTEEAVDQLISAVEKHPDARDFKPGYIDLEHWESGMMFIPFDEKYLDPDVLAADPEAMAEGIEGYSDDRVSIPVMYETRREVDDSGTFKAMVGKPFSTIGEEVEFVPFSGNQEPGSVTIRSFEPGKFFARRHPNPPARTANDLYKQIQSSLRPDSAEVYDGSQGYVQTVGFMMEDWKFDQDQTKALLGSILKLDGMEVLGTTIDRWNREAVVFGVDTRRTEGGTYRTMLLFNPETGRLTNYSEEYLTDKEPAETPDFASNTVVRYFAVSE